MVIYEIRNKINGKVYIGQTTQEAQLRWYSHQSVARTAKKKEHPLYNSMRKHGIEQFEFTVIDTASSIDELNSKERQYLSQARLRGEVYNLQEGGNNKKHSQVSIERMREAQRAAHARRKSEGKDTWTRRDGGPMLGKTHPAKGKPGKKRTPEQIENIRAASKASAALRKGMTWQVVNGKRVWMET